jgi:hypothetical protein
MMNVGTTLRVVLLVHGGPYVRGRRAANELASDDRLHGAKEETEDPLVRDPPAGVLWVGDIHGGIAGALLDGLCRSRCSAIEVALPQHEVVGVETNRGGCGEAKAVEALVTETIALEGATSVRAKVEDIPW